MYKTTEYNEYVEKFGDLTLRIGQDGEDDIELTTDKGS